MTTEYDQQDIDELKASFTNEEEHRFIDNIVFLEQLNLSDYNIVGFTFTNVEFKKSFFIDGLKSGLS